MSRHRLDLFSLLAGLVFTAIAVLALNPGWTTGAVEWLWPAILVGGGVVALVATLAADRRGPDAATPAEPHAEAEAEGAGDAADVVDDEVAAHHLDAALVAEARTEVEQADPFSG